MERPQTFEATGEDQTILVGGSWLWEDGFKDQRFPQQTPEENKFVAGILSRIEAKYIVTRGLEVWKFNYPKVGEDNWLSKAIIANEGELVGIDAKLDIVEDPEHILHNKLTFSPVMRETRASSLSITY